MVGVPVGTDEYAMESVMDIVQNGGAEQLARMLSRMPDKQAGNLIATGSMVQRTAYIKRVMDPELSLPACLKVDGNAMWMLEKWIDLPGTAEETSFFENGCPTNQLVLQPYQQAQARLTTGAGGFGLASVEARRTTASIGSLVATVPEVLADLSGVIGDKARSELPDSDLVRRIWNSTGTSTMCTGLQRKPLRTSCRKAGGIEHFEEESTRPQGGWLRKCCRHMMPNLSAPAKRSIDWGSW